MRMDFERWEVPIAVAVGGAVGSLARWTIAAAITLEAFPLATFITNMLGSFALGVALVAGEVIGGHQGHHHHRQRRLVRLWRPFMATGVLGGFTTFSTFVVEINRMSTGMALLYLVSSIGLGLAAYGAGNTLTRTALGVRS